MHCVFGGTANPTILRETCWRESTFQALSAVSLCHALYVYAELINYKGLPLMLMFQIVLKVETIAIDHCYSFGV